MKNKHLTQLVIIFVAAMIAFGLNLTALAADDPNKLTPASVDQIFPIVGIEGEETGGENDPTAAVSALPKVSMQSMVTTIIKNILSSSFVITILALVVTGIYYLISEGNDEQTGKAKKILLYLIIGMAIIGASYSIVSGITRFKLLE